MESRNDRHRGDRRADRPRYDYGRSYDRHHDRGRDRHDRRSERRHYRDQRNRHHGSYDHGYKYGHPRHQRYRSRPWFDCDFRGGVYLRLGGYRDRFFNVPRLILGSRSHNYTDYYYDRIYHSPHGRWYEVYLFPVYYHDRVEYRPYVYCEGQLYGRARFDTRGGLAFEIEFDF